MIIDIGDPDEARETLEVVKVALVQNMVPDRFRHLERIGGWLDAISQELPAL